ncbi:MAG: DNA replication/repair protein RecF [Chloroflexi bacterium]|nr:DNA replication/repair protein RecF [Chloroflexota bacterium]
MLPVYVSHLSLTNFRNYHRLEMDIPAGLVVIFGGNAQGKSNLLEAVYLLSIAKAYRASGDREAICRAAVEDPDHTQVLGIVHRGQDRVRIAVDMHLEQSLLEDGQPYLRKDVRVNGVHVSASDLVGVVNAVLFDAEDIQLVSGPPAIRRRYLDILICQLDRPYLRALQRYQKVVYQRNHLLRLLRERRAQPGEMDFWNEAMVQEGAHITLRRHQVVQELRQLVSGLHCELTEAQEELSMEYVPSVPLEGVEKEDIHRSFQRTLEEGREREMALGSSQWGPHRDDLRLMVGGMEAASYASRGQARTLAISLKLAEGTLLERERGESPILLLDDVFSELDASRRRRLLEYVSRSQQALVSTTDLDRIESHFLAQASKFLVGKGSVSPL